MEKKNVIVLILVLMEDTLRAVNEVKQVKAVQVS